jgi:hypothetical protein
MAYLAPLTLRVAAEPLRRFVLLNARPYRLEGEGVRREFMFAARLETDRWTEGLEIQRRTRVMTALSL